MKKKLAIIGASYLQLPLVKKAKEMGLRFIDVNKQSLLTQTFPWNRRSIEQWIKAIAESELVF